MKKLRKTDYAIIAVLIILLSGILLLIANGKKDSTANIAQTDTSTVSVEDRPFSYYAENKKIGALTGGLYELMIQERFPDAEILQFNNQPDMAVALSAGKIDAFTCARSSAEEFMKADDTLTCLNEVFMEIPYGFAFQKSEDKVYLRDQMNEFLQKLHSDGTYDDIVAQWFGDDESVKHVDYSGLTGKNGTIRYITASAMQPFSYIADGKNAGIEVDIITRFCREYGYDIKIDDAEFASLIPGITSGMYDIASGTIMITEERAESVNFSDVYYTADAVAVVRKEENADIQTQKKYTFAADFNGKRLGIKTGSSFEAVTLEKFPDAEYFYYDSTSDLIAALDNNKIDAFVEDEPVARMAHNENRDVDYLHEPLLKEDYSFGFSKKNNTEKTLTEFNEYLDEIRNDGSYAQLLDKWLGSNESKKTVDNYDLSDKNGTLKVVVLPDNVPFAYTSNNELGGFAVELTLKFAEKYGYSIEFEQADAAAGFAGMSSGKYDIFAGSLSVTEERKESIDFSDPFYNGGMVLMARTADINDENDKPYSSFSNKRIGIVTGSSFEAITLEKFPDAEYFYYDSTSDLVTALENNKIDAFVNDEPVARMAHNENSSIDYIHEPLIKDDYCFGFCKSKDSEKLMAEFNEYLAGIKADGSYETLLNKWFEGDESAKSLGEYKLSGENGKLKACVIPDLVPFSYISNNELGGLVVELTLDFAEKYGYGIEFEQANAAACLAGLNSGKYDILASNLSVTEERKETINFSDPFYNGGMVLMARTTDINDENEKSYFIFNGRRIGIRTGAATEPMTFELFPDSDYSYLDSTSDLTAALQNKKIDAFLEDEPVAAILHSEQPDVDYIREPIIDDDYHFGFQKDTQRSEKLQSEFNSLIAELKADGTLEQMREKWINGDDDDKTFDNSKLTGENGSITVAVVPDSVPFAYTADNELKGYAVELATIFARKYGYSIVFEQANLTSCLSGLSTGKYDMFAWCLSYTDERAESIDYSDVIYNGGIVLVARSFDISNDSSAAVENETWLDSIKTSFEKNFIRESRYKLILKGIGTTCIITVLTVIFGSVLAFLICLFRRTDSLLAGKISDIYVKLLQGTPMVVLLMILYYVIFGKSGMPAIWVAVIGFSLNFAAYVSETLRSGIESIDGGQREAALALGYSENQAFFRFIFPQAAVRQLPVYRGEIISLLKNTSIVGYIAIQDLTKMSDIIRSRTYEAFFPLIATAVIYFILAWLISLILKLVMRKIDTRSKKRAVKGGTEK